MYHKIRRCAGVALRPLPRGRGGEQGRIHPRARQGPRAAQERRCGHDQGIVHARVRAGLKEQGDVQAHHAGPGPAVLYEKLGLIRVDVGVDEGLQPRGLRWACKREPCQGLAVNIFTLWIQHRIAPAREGPGQEVRCAARRRVGLVHRHAHVFQQRARRGLPRRHGAREAEDDHGAPP